ncbi:RHS repeat-associated core domain-containing protein [Luteibacter sp. UNCMF366Tsu5.1]|nr:RHS repeat-associated core domain-containing protein [Luteibacter sp. UNCMF366Tsu5.1]
MKWFYVGVVSLAVFLCAAIFPPLVKAYVSTTRSEALAYCESGIAWEEENKNADWVFYGSCKDGPYTQPYPDYLGCYTLWGHYDIPDEGVYGTDAAITTACYGIDDDPAGKNLGSAGGCDGGEGGCTAGGASSGAPTAGDPINTATGNKYVEETDFGDIDWLTFRRFYNSDPSASSSSMGLRWSHSFNRRLDRATLWNGSFTVTVYRPNGLRELFHKTGSSAWTTSPDNPDTLTEIDDAAGNVTGYSLWLAALRHTETYTVDGRLLTIQDDTGQTATLSYSDSTTPYAIAPQPNLLLSVTAPNGRSLTFTYDNSSKVHQMTVPDGHVFTYAYDSTGNLISVTYPDQNKRQYLYGEQAFTGGANLLHAMTGLVDENGSRLETTYYDSSARSTSTESAGGADKVSVAYNADGTSDVTFSLGAVSHQSYAKVQGLVRIAALDKPCGSCGQSFASRTYDANARPSGYTDFNGNISQVTYDANGLLTQQVEASGTTDQRLTKTTWNVPLRKPLVRTVKDSSGKVVSQKGWAYNANGQTTASCLIDPGQASSYVCSATGTPPPGVRRTVNTYCSSVDAVACPLVGLLLASDGPRSDVSDIVNYAWYMTTDESGCASIGGVCHRQGDLKSVTDANGLVTTYVSYDKAGRVTRVRAPDGTLTDLSYTGRGWLNRRTTHSETDAITTLNYNADGTVHEVIDPDGVTTTYTYDAAHRLTDITDGDGNRQHYTLDASGNQTKREIYTSAGTLVTSVSKFFNNLGQLTSLTDGLGRTVFSAASTDSYDGNGNLVFSRDGLGYQNKRVFDGLDRLVSTIQNYQGTDPGTKNSQSVTSLDALDRVTGFSDPDGLNTSYDIDGLGNGKATDSPDTGLTARTFDVAGNVLTSTDALNNTRTMTYDASDRLLTVSFANPSSNIQYKYDEADAVTGCTGNHGAGHRTRVVEASGGITWCYDGRGNVLSKRQTIGADTRTTIYSWTPGNRLASVTTPNGTHVAYSRDNRGHTAKVTATPAGGVATTMASNVSYTAFGPIASLTLGDGQTVAYTYDLTGALTDIVSAAFTLHMKRDAMGNLIAIGDSAGVPTAKESYAYDPLYRLAAVNDPSGTAVEAYTYNKTGDRLSKTGAGVLTGTYGYASGTHHLTTVGTTSRTIDARGSTTSSVLASGAWTYVYDQRNRMTSVQKDGATVASYLLNALGQRVQKAIGASATRFDYDEANTLLSEATGSTTRDYIWMDNLPIGVVDRAGTASSIAFVHSDSLGSPRAVTNAAGNLLWQWPYPGNPFGEVTPVSAAGYVLNMRFPGQYFDAEIGLSYNVNRDYEPATGRYMQSDPMGLAAGVSTYAYVSNTPLIYSDSLGLCDEDRCDQLREKITRLRNELAKRYGDLQADTLGLPLTGPMSIGGHEQQFANKQTQLRRLLSEFEALGCKGGIPSDSWDWATKDAPSPSRGRGPAPKSDNIAPLTAAGVVAARVIFVIVNTASELL